MNLTLPIIGLLAFYLINYLVIRGLSVHHLLPSDRKAFLLTGGLWSVSVFLGNYFLYRVGVMSFTPWILNGLHCFIWIGLVLTFLYFSTRYSSSLWQQALYFVFFSLIVKFAEQQLFGIWEHGHFFWLFKSNYAYILGWSLMDGIYPFLTKYALRMLGRNINGLTIS